MNGRDVIITYIKKGCLVQRRAHDINPDATKERLVEFAAGINRLMRSECQIVDISFAEERGEP